MASNDSPSQKQLTKIIDSAKRLGVELDEADALQWLSAMALDDDTFRFDKKTGVFGHRVSMLDFSPADLAHFRKLGKLVEFEDTPGKVETALALSGSAAQSKIQTYPGDADFFERINIIADTREEATDILANLMRVKALSTFKGDTYEFIEAKFGSFPFDFVRDGNLEKAGSPIAWSGQDVKEGKIIGTSAESDYLEITWEQAAEDPGWCKLDWVVADAAHKPAGQCQQHARCHLGSTGRLDHPIGWLSRLLLPGSLPGSGLDPNFLANWSSMSPVTRWTTMSVSWKMKYSKYFTKAPITVKPQSVCTTFSA